MLPAGNCSIADDDVETLLGCDDDTFLKNEQITRRLSERNRRVFTRKTLLL